MRQLTVAGPSGKTIRPDLMLYVNGLPLLVIELKDPADTAADLDVAIDQLGRYKPIAPDLFVPNLLLVGPRRAADAGRVASPAGGSVHAVAAGDGRRADAGGADPRAARAARRCWITCGRAWRSRRTSAANIVKKVAGYHQFRAVRKARASVLGALKPPDAGDEATGKGGVVWHTQGSRQEPDDADARRHAGRASRRWPTRRS